VSTNAETQENSYLLILMKLVFNQLNQYPRLSLLAGISFILMFRKYHKTEAAASMKNTSICTECLK
jgi:hypothetical protein